jgi:isocitrate dehydrogenase
MIQYKKVVVPLKGEPVKIEDDKLVVPDCPVIPFIEGDGIGADIWKAAKQVIDAAVNKAYNGEKRIEWMEVYAGEKALKVYGKHNWLPDETLEVLKEFIIAVKGPLTTPVGGGIRSINVTLRQKLDLFASVRPVKYYPGVPSPVRHPNNLNVVVFRENTEDVYTGVEFEAGSVEADKLIKYINKTFNKNIPPDSALGIKQMTRFCTERLMRKAVDYAIANKLKNITIVHKGNIQKFTEGSFMEWSYETAAKYYPRKTITVEELENRYDGRQPEGKILIRDLIADNMFQQILLNPKDYDLLVTPNLNGDYISDSCAAQVGGLGMAPGANFSYHHALFEAAHGSAPRLAGLDIANPGALILSGVMMLNYMGWNLAAKMIEKALEKTIKSKVVTSDFARQMKGAIEVKCSQFAREIIKNMK